jgi:hypothetical protein
MPGHPHNYTKPGLGPLPPNVFVPDCNDPTLGRSPHAQYELWGLAEDDEVLMLQLIPALVVFVLAVLDLQLRTPALSPVREHRECQMSITAILPSLVWRTINWCTCCLWIVMELWGRAIDIPEVVFLMHCAGDCVEGDIVGQDCTPGGPPRVRELGDLAQRQILKEYATVDDLRLLMRPIAVAAPLLLLVNGLLCFWAWQYYSGVHNVYRNLFERGPEWFKTVATPDAYLSELSGMELILGAADTMLVNLPVCWMANRLYDSGLGLGFYGHINLAMSIVTYILNTWLFADKSPIIDSYRWQNGGT